MNVWEWADLLGFLVVTGLVCYSLWLLYRSTKIKQQAQWKPKFEAEPENYIPFSYRKLKSTMLQRVVDEASREQLTTLFQRLELLLHIKYYPDSRSLLHHFSVFNPKTTPQEYRHLTELKVMQIEDRFLSLCQTLLLRANFKPITQEEFEFALREDYLNTLPVRIDWNGLDSEMFRRHRLKFEKSGGVSSDSEKLRNMLFFSDKVWAFRRGIGSDTTEGWYIFEKIDHMLVIAFGRLLNAIYSVLSRVPVLQNKVTQKEPKEDFQSESTGLRMKGKNEHVDPYSNVVERITLHDIVKKKGVACLFKKSRIKEPTYKEVVLMYRRSQAPSKDLTESSTPSLNDRAIFIKSFSDIPISDLETIFPEKKISIRPMDIVWLTATGCTGIATITFHLYDQLHSWFGFAIVISFLAFVARIFMTYRMSIIYYQSSLLSFLYDRSMDNDDGVILYLVEQLKSQELKERTLLYFFLWFYGPQTAEELSYACESFFLDLQSDKMRKIRVRFAARDTLARLLTMGIIKELPAVEGEVNQEPQYEALPTKSAEAKLKEIHRELYSLPSNEQPPIPS